MFQPRFEINWAKEICSLEVETIDGEAEGCFSAKGVLAGIPNAEGVVGDLGGGSLELVRILDGAPTKVVSLPIGSLKLAEVRKHGSEKLRRFIKAALRKVDWAGEGKGLPFYMVGGSWRALAQLQMHLSDHPLPIAHQCEMSPKVVDRLARVRVHTPRMLCIRAAPEILFRLAHSLCLRCVA